MKVIVLFKDGSKREIAVPETSFSQPTAAQAIEYAQTQLAKSERDSVKTYEAEEDFI